MRLTGNDTSFRFFIISVGESGNSTSEVFGPHQIAPFQTPITKTFVHNIKHSSNPLRTLLIDRNKVHTAHPSIICSISTLLFLLCVIARETSTTNAKRSLIPISANLVSKVRVRTHSNSRRLVGCACCCYATVQLRTLRYSISVNVGASNTVVSTRYVFSVKLGGWCVIPRTRKWLLRMNLVHQSTRCRFAFLFVLMILHKLIESTARIPTHPTSCYVYSF